MHSSYGHHLEYGHSKWECLVHSSLLLIHRYPWRREVIHKCLGSTIHMEMWVEFFVFVFILFQRNRGRNKERDRSSTNSLPK